MAEADTAVLSILIGDHVPASDIDELVRLLNDAEVDALVGPAPRRMGPLPDLPELVTVTIEASISLVASLVLTAAGQRIWQFLSQTARGGRQRPAIAGEDPPAVVVVHDPDSGIRLELAWDDLADPRLRQELARLSTLKQDSAEIVMRWDGSGSGGFTIRSGGEPAEDFR